MGTPRDRLRNIPISLACINSSGRFVYLYLTQFATREHMAGMTSRTRYQWRCTLDGVPPREREDVHRRATFAEAENERGQSFKIIDLIMRMQRQKSGRAARNEIARSSTTLRQVMPLRTFNIWRAKASVPSETSRDLNARGSPFPNLNSENPTSDLSLKLERDYEERVNDNKSIFTFL